MTVNRIEGPTGTTEARPDYEFVVVGAGFGGLGVGIELLRLGISDFVILERAGDVGGTWRDNTYPGLEVDVPSFNYSYVFEMKPDWSQLYAPGIEIKAYADHCADKYGLRTHIRFHSTVVEARFETDSLWHVRRSDGDVLTCRYLVNACGYLNEPKLPDIKGFDDYSGKVIHTARWDHDYDLEGKRVAIIGTGATAIQLAPAIVDRLEHLDIYQRTPIWLAPKPNPVFSEQAKQRMRRIPMLPRAARALVWLITELFFQAAFLHHKRFPWTTNKLQQGLANYVRRQVHDPVIAEKLIPDYSFFCKRPSFSTTFYPLFNRDDVELVTDPISHLAPKGIVTGDGTLREVDVVVCATGFRVFDRLSAPMFDVVGENGTDLRDWWAENGYQAYLGTTVPNFPNFFLIVGPYASIGSSYFDFLNYQVVHISRVLRAARRRGANYVAIKRRAHDRDFRKVRRGAQRSVLGSPTCLTSNTYYLDERGHSPAGPRPCSLTGLWLKTRLFRIDNYRFEDRTATKSLTARPVSLEVA